MAVDIGPKIGIDGEAEFRSNLTRINQTIKTLGSEMKAVTSAFIGNEDSMDSLSAQSKVFTKQIEAQEEKLEELQKGLAAATEKYDAADAKTLRWAQAVNEATADLNKMKSQLNAVTREMDDMESSTDDLTDSLDDAGAGFGDLGDMLAKGLTAGAAVAAVKEVTSALFELEESTREYRTIMASLESSSERAGYNAEQTAQIYGTLQSVLGDTQSAATATANLQALSLEQEKLQAITNASIGAWATYGNSIPIDSLAESINETIQAGTVTGTFADVLNWAGTSEDDFNAKLQAANSSTERANIVLQELTNQGLVQAGAQWAANNEAITANNEATEKLNQATARLGEAIAPTTAAAKSFAADALNLLIDSAEALVQHFTVDVPNGLKGFGEAVAELPGEMKEIGSNIIIGMWEGLKEKSTWIKDKVSGYIADIKSLFTGPEGFDVHSPSKWAEGVFENVMAGGTIGLEKGSQGTLSELDSVMRSMKARMQQPMDMVSNSSLGEYLSGAVNGIGAITATSGGVYRIEIPVNIDGVEYLRLHIDDIRSVMKANPEVATA